MSKKEQQLEKRIKSLLKAKEYFENLALERGKVIEKQRNVLNSIQTKRDEMNELRREIYALEKLRKF